MKLAFCIFNYFPYGGLQKDFMHILLACLARGHVIDVYAMTWTGEVPENIHLFLLPQTGFTNHHQAKKFSSEIQTILAKKAKKNKHDKYYDCITGFNKMSGLDIYFAADDCFIKNMAQGKLGKLRKLFLSRYKTYAHLEKKIFEPQNFTKILVLTEQQRQDFITHYGTPFERFVLLSPSIDAVFKNFKHYFDNRENLRTELGLTQDTPMILIIASYFKTKGLDRALKALAFLNTQSLSPSPHLFIIGGDDVSPYIKLIKKLGITQQVHFLGAQKNVMSFYASADIFLHLAYREAGGKVLIEALAAGLPVLTTDICGYSTHVAAAKAGTVLPSPFDQDQCHQALIDLLQPQKLKLLRENAQTYIASHAMYNLGETVADFIERHAKAA